jgi:CRP/FNR family transcriptional regulator, cyclic AMP receptor protein
MSTVKRLLARLKRDPAPRGDASAFPDTTDSSSTGFQDTVEDATMMALWSQRRMAIAANPVDPARGAALFEGLWGGDRWVAGLAASERARLAQHLEFVQVGAGREVIAQDEQGDYMVIVLEGRLAVERVQPWGGRSPFGEARPGDMLGEMSLLDAGARFCACTTLTPCVFAVLEAHRLDALLRAEPRLGVALLAALARRLSLRLRQVSVRLSALTPRA